MRFADSSSEVIGLFHVPKAAVWGPDITSRMKRESILLQIERLVDRKIVDSNRKAEASTKCEAFSGNQIYLYGLGIRVVNTLAAICCGLKPSVLTPGLEGWCGEKD